MGHLLIFTFIKKFHLYVGRVLGFLEMNPDSHWNNHSDVYESNKDNILDWEVKIINKKDLIKLL